MATYTGIKGQSVQVVSSDPSPLIPGQIWYNSTSNTLKAAVQEAGSPAWTTVGVLNTGRRTLAGAGTNTAALAFGGNPNPITGATESYNGTSWTTGGSMGQATYGRGRELLAGAGTNTAALAFGGRNNPVGSYGRCTESYNGSTWTAGGALINCRNAHGGAGTSNTAALAFGGAGFPKMRCTESYNGSTWTAGGAMGTGRYELGGAGTSTSALAFGGYCYDNMSSTESYNGSTWTAGGSLGTARRRISGSGTSNTAALAFGGSTASNASALTCAESYNGTSWTAVGAINTARYNFAGAGTNTAALAFGGEDGATYVADQTESYGSGLTTATKTLTIS
jgi:hypothetical protein